MASLLSLSAELKLSIIEQLKPPTIEQLDLDLGFDSLVLTPPKDIFNLSRVCSVFRALTAPIRFRDIILASDEKSGLSVSAVLNSADARHVRSLYYVVIKPTPDGQDFERKEALVNPSQDDLPDSVGVVLASLSSFPNLDKVTIQFACDKTNEEDDLIYQTSHYHFEGPEDIEAVREAETIEAFRFLMEQSYQALSRNNAGVLKHLELKNVVAKECSAWRLEGFQALLGELQSFKMNLCGGDNGAGWKVDNLIGYLDFVSQLDTYFFKCLSSVTEFSFAAARDGPPGSAACMGLPLLDQHMPQLRSLSLEHVSIGCELADFITAHGRTLETITFAKCYSQWPEQTLEDTITWADFFFRIAAKEPKALLAFHIFDSDVEQWEPVPETHWRYNNVKQLAELQAQYPQRRMFDYKHVDGECGMFFDSEEEACERFREGSDHRGWSQMCRLMERNCCTCGKCGR